MDKIILETPTENFHDQAKVLTVPMKAYLVSQDDNQDVLLVYEDLDRAA